MHHIPRENYAYDCDELQSGSVEQDKPKLVLDEKVFESINRQFLDHDVRTDVNSRLARVYLAVQNGEDVWVVMVSILLLVCLYELTSASQDRYEGTLEGLLSSLDESQEDSLDFLWFDSDFVLELLKSIVSQTEMTTTWMC